VSHAFFKVNFEGLMPFLVNFEEKIISHLLKLGASPDAVPPPGFEPWCEASQPITFTSATVNHLARTELSLLLARSYVLENVL
jgi:hypothetical protein